MWVCCLNLLPDSYAGLQRGTIRALNLQNKSLIVTFIAFWLVGISSQIYLAINLK